MPSAELSRNTSEHARLSKKKLQAKKIESSPDFDRGWRGGGKGGGGHPSRVGSTSGQRVPAACTEEPSPWTLPLSQWGLLETFAQLATEKRRAVIQALCQQELCVFPQFLKRREKERKNNPTCDPKKLNAAHSPRLDGQIPRYVRRSLGHSSGCNEPDVYCFVSLLGFGNPPTPLTPTAYPDTHVSVPASSVTPPNSLLSTTRGGGGGSRSGWSSQEHSAS